MDYEKDYERGFIEKCAEMQLDPEMVKEAFLGGVARGAGRMASRGLGMVGRGAKGGLARAGRYVGGKMLGGRDPSKSLMGWAGKQIGQYSDDVTKAVGQRGRLATNAAKGGRMQAANMGRYSKGQKALGIGDAMLGAGVLGAGGLGAMSMGGGGQPQGMQMPPGMTYQQPSFHDMARTGMGSSPFMID